MANQFMAGEESGRGNLARSLLDDMDNATEDIAPRITTGLRTPPSRQAGASSLITPPASQASTVPRAPSSRSGAGSGFMNGGGGRARGRALPNSLIAASPARDPRTDPRITNREARASAAADEDEDGDMPARRVPATGGVIRSNAADGIDSAGGVNSAASNMNVSRANDADVSRANDADAPPITDTGNGRFFSSAFNYTDAQNERNVRMRASIQQEAPTVLARATERSTNASAAREQWKQTQQTDLHDVTEIQALIANSVMDQVGDIPGTARLFDSLEQMHDDKLHQLIRAELRGDVRITGDCLDFIEVLLKRLRETNTKIVVDMQTKANNTMSIEGMYDLLVLTYNKCVTRKKEMKVKPCSCIVHYTSHFSLIDMVGVCFYRRKTWPSPP